MRDSNAFSLAGDEGFEPPILGPEPSALPLGQSPTRISQREQIRIFNFWDSTHLWRARNFVFEIKFSREGCLASCHRQLSPRMLGPEPKLLGSPQNSILWGVSLYHWAIPHRRSVIVMLQSLLLSKMRIPSQFRQGPLTSRGYYSLYP
jgi:hypothetical protein